MWSGGCDPSRINWRLLEQRLAFQEPLFVRLVPFLRSVRVRDGQRVVPHVQKLCIFGDIFFGGMKVRQSIRRDTLEVFQELRLGVAAVSLETTKGRFKGWLMYREYSSISLLVTVGLSESRTN